jgi:hypothetical protein
MQAWLLFIRGGKFSCVNSLLRTLSSCLHLSTRPHPSALPCTCLLLQLEEVEEVAGLDEEADLPLEELLARYGNYHLQAAAGGGGEEDEEMPGGWGWAGLPFLLCLLLPWHSTPMQRAGTGMIRVMQFDAHARPLAAVSARLPHLPPQMPGREQQRRRLQL